MWFKSKLQNPDPEIRRQHIEHLEPDDELLSELAQTDPHPDVRSAALSRVVDLAILKTMASNDTETRIRSQAVARLQTLLAGADDATPALELRLQFLADSEDERLVRFLARNAAEPELRKSALNQMLQHDDDPNVQDLLCDIAADDAVQEIRQAAAEPLHDVRRLQTLLEKTRSRDKSIHRLARDRLDAIAAQANARETLEKCCLDIEQLCIHQFSAEGKIEEARQNKIADEWDKAAAVIDKMDEQLQARYVTGRDVIQRKLAALAEQRRARNDILTALRAHLNDTGSEPISGLIKRWHDLDEPAAAEAREFTKLVAKVTEHDSQRDRDAHRVVAKEALLKRMEQAAAQESIRKNTLTAIEKRWEAAQDPEDEVQKKALHEAFLGLREKLRAKLEKQASELNERLAKVNVLLDQYETALADGKLQVVVSMHDKIANALHQLEAPTEKKQALVRRLRAGEPKMAELRQWRHWGTEKKREELCQFVESVPTAGMKIPAVAKAVRESREAWKALDRSDGPAGKKLWKRFDGACEKAYEPCQVHFEQQKAQRQENMARRVAICEELEALESNTDWDAPPWRELTDALRETQRKWHVAGSVDRREKNTIQKRYEQARAALDERLGAMRQQEIDRREALIERVEALGSTDNTTTAVETAKRAQREWRPLVQAGRGQEQELWKRFRAACDAVFEQRKEQFAAADNERAQNLGERLAVCGQIDVLAAEVKVHLDAATGTKELLTETRKKVRQLSTGWQRIGPAPRDKQQAVERQFARAAKDLEQLCSRIDRQLKQQAVRLRREAAKECDELELKVAGGTSIELAAVEQILSKLAPVVGDTGLTPRLKRLEGAANGDEKAQKEIREALPSNLETRRRVCLEMEIAANIDSPRECEEERMQYRVRQLSESMSGNRKPMTPAEMEQLWYQTGPVLEAEKVALDERFQRALKALGDD